MSGNKTIPGTPLTQSALNSAAPFGDVGIDLTQLVDGGARPDRWLVSLEASSETARASLNLGVPSADLDTTVRAKAPFLGTLGNGIGVVATATRTDGTVVVTDDLETMTVTIDYDPDVSTVLDVENAITAQSALIEVSVAGTAATVLDVGDVFARSPLAGGTDAATTFIITVWGRDATTKRWGKHNDSYGRIVAGVLFNGVAVGRHHAFTRDLGNYDRVYFQRDGATGVADMRLTEILTTGRGN